jgi:hypothetical protein
MTEFLPRQPNLYTVEAHGRPVVVISATASLGLPDDAMLVNPNIRERLRLMRRAKSLWNDLAKRLRIDPDDSEVRISLREIDAALETYLGEDLRTMEDVAQPGRPLWDGKWKNIRVRRATDKEAETWKSSLLAAMRAGEQEPGEMDWLVFLIAVSRGYVRSPSGGRT